MRFTIYYQFTRQLPIGEIIIWTENKHRINEKASSGTSFVCDSTTKYESPGSFQYLRDDAMSLAYTHTP